MFHYLFQFLLLRSVLICFEIHHSLHLFSGYLTLENPHIFIPEQNAHLTHWKMNCYDKISNNRLVVPNQIIHKVNALVKNAEIYNTTNALKYRTKSGRK